MKVEFATRLDASLRRRLRVFAAVSERTIEDIVSAALDGYLPPAAEMISGPGADLPEAATR
jgi:hypothetical protein